MENSRRHAGKTEIVIAACAALTIASLFISFAGLDELKELEVLEELSSDRELSPPLMSTAQGVGIVKLGITLPKGPARVMVYRNMARAHTGREIGHLVTAANLDREFTSGCYMDNNRTKCAAKSNDNVLHLQLDPVSGAFGLTNMSYREPRCDFTKPNAGLALIDRGNAVRIAREYLNARGWMPPEGEYVVGFGYAGCSNGTNDYLSALHVGFNRVMRDGSLVIGDGVTISSILPDGGFERVAKMWHQLEPVHEIDIIPPAKAYDRLVRGETVYQRPTGAEFKVTNVTIGYRVGHWGETGEDLVAPTWVFAGELDGSKTLAFVSAIDRSVP